MKRLTSAFFAAMTVLASFAISQEPPLAPKVFSDTTLGFRYSPPPGLRDVTEGARQDINRRASQAKTTKVITMLLMLLSGPDPSAAGWHSVAIETYPREKIQAANDREASVRFARMVVNNAQPEVGEPTDVEIGHFHFVVLRLRGHNGSLTKYGLVYTTVAKGAMLSFGFGANSEGVLERLAKSMKSVSPLPPKQEGTR